MARTEEKTYEEISGRFLYETDKAILLRVMKREVWIPKSQLGDVKEGELEVDTEVTVMVATWICDKLGLDYDPT